jgi:methionine-rich copper-binding protein CopC
VRFRLSRPLPLLIALATILPAAPAHAHAKLMSTSPVAGSGVAAPPTVTLRYDDVVELPPGALRITGPHGNKVPLHEQQPDSKTLAGRLAGDLEPGRYRVRWRIVADDGHIESGTFAFVVRAGGKHAAAAAVPARGSLPSRHGGGTAAVVLTLLLSLVTIAAIGVGVVRLRKQRVYGSGSRGG